MHVGFALHNIVDLICPEKFDKKICRIKFFAIIFYWIKGTQIKAVYSSYTLFQLYTLILIWYTFGYMGINFGEERGQCPLRSDSEGGEICLAPPVFWASNAHLALKVNQCCWVKAKSIRLWLPGFISVRLWLPTL